MSDKWQIFRSVPRTGVIYVMAKAHDQGFVYGDSQWSNLGQGAPETGDLGHGPARVQNIGVDATSSEYSPVPGLRALREAVANLYNQRYRQGKASQYTAENVAISGGGRIGLARIAAALGSINLGHFLPDYTAYEELLELFRAFVPIPIVLRASEGFATTAERIADEITSKGLGGILLSNPCNPTGHVIHGKELQSIVGQCTAQSCALIVDEFYSHYVYGDAAKEGPVSAARYIENVEDEPIVIVDGLTKNWRYPGMRLSWTLAPKTIIEQVASVGSFLDGGPSHPIQQKALGLVNPEWANQEAHSIAKVFGEKRRYMLDKVKGLGMRCANDPLGSFYCFCSIDELPAPLADGMTFFEEALKRQVIVVPGEFFDVDPGQRRARLRSRLKGFVRLSFGPSMEELIRGMDRLEEMIREHR